MNQTLLLVPALGAVYPALAPWVEALLRFAVGMAMIPHGFRMCLGYFKGTGGPISSVPAVAAMYDRKGFKPGWFWATGTVLTQFVAAPCVGIVPEPWSVTYTPLPRLVIAVAVNVPALTVIVSPLLAML